MKLLQNPTGFLVQNLPHVTHFQVCLMEILIQKHLKSRDCTHLHFLILAFRPAMDHDSAKALTNFIDYQVYDGFPPRLEATSEALETVRGLIQGHQPPPQLFPQQDFLAEVHESIRRIPCHRKF